ncbi:MAG TPA: 16S rRNA pseudouridine(516) synthase [Oceanospirillaceae bacterium]|nr:16S rRNA pseudouridine(516) synthase [Oceanospirillaceae bacterium]
MTSYATRLDKFVGQQLGYKKRQVQLLLAQGLVTLDNKVCHHGEQLIGQFSKVAVDLDGEIKVLRHIKPLYIMLHKPAGVVSATVDDQHTTVLDLLPPEYHSLHIAGRLDLSSTGLLLLTNDGQWSRLITQPDTKLAKYYTVTLANPITQAQVDAFAQGIYFAFEDLTTAPAQLNILTATSAQVILKQGRYHQIKRMFGHFRNPVLSIHRTQIGHIKLPPSMAAGDYRVVSDPMDF